MARIIGVKVLRGRLRMALFDNIVGYWKADSNGSFPDSVASDDGTISGGVTYDASGKINGCQDFDGSNSSIALATNDRTSSFTYNFWGYRNSAWSATADKNNFFEHTNAATIGILIGYNTVQGKPQAVVNTGSGWTFIGSTNVSADAWHMYSLTYDGTTVKYYIDNVLVGSSVMSVMTGITSFKRIGRYGNSYADMKFDEFGIFDDVVSISDLWNDGDGLAYPFTTAADNTIFMGMNF